MKYDEQFPKEHNEILLKSSLLFSCMYTQSASRISCTAYLSTQRRYESIATISRVPEIFGETNAASHEHNLLATRMLINILWDAP